MKEKNLREALEKCSKAELIQIIMRASNWTYAAFPWMEIIGEIRLNEIESGIDANIAEGKELARKFSEMAKNPNNYSENEILEIRIALAKNQKEWERLNMKHDKIFKELYR
jgi:hypothetical protein